MLQFQTWKIVLILGVCLIGLLTAFPNVMPASWQNWVARNASVIPHRPITLGLDLRGGVYVLFEAKIAVAVKDRMQSLLEDVRGVLRKAKITYSGLSASDSAVSVKILDLDKIEEARTLLRGLAQPAGAVFGGVTASDYELSLADDGSAALTITDAGREQIRANAMAQSVETLRKRIDPEGTKEVTIQPQGKERIIVQVPGENDPARIIKLGSTAAKLTFHMVDDNVSREDIAAKRLPPGTRQLEETVGRGPAAQKVPIVIKERAVITGDMIHSPIQARYPELGDASIRARSAALGDPISAGESRDYQIYYRDANPTFCPAPQGSTFNATGAVAVAWQS